MQLLAVPHSDRVYRQTGSENRLQHLDQGAQGSRSSLFDKNVTRLGLEQCHFHQLDRPGQGEHKAGHLRLGQRDRLSRLNLPDK